MKEKLLQAIKESKSVWKVNELTVCVDGAYNDDAITLDEWNDLQIALRDKRNEIKPL
jgi:transposase-like protein